MVNPAKPIARYIYVKGINCKIFAQICKISIVSVYNYLKGRPMKRFIALKIEKATRCELVYEELCSEPKRVKTEDRCKHI
jgi:hypothetical protein